MEDGLLAGQQLAVATEERSPGRLAHRANPQIPNFFVVGAAKAGTTSLYRYLKSHPQIYMSPIKEPCYFATDLDVRTFDADYRYDHFENYPEYIEGDMAEPVHIAYVTNFENYLRLFRKVRDEKAIGEASVAYLYSKCAALEIRARIPHAKIIITLRHPAERAFSHYLMDLRIGRVNRSFSEELTDDLRKPEKAWGRTRLYIEQGLYFEQVKRFLEAFGRAQVKIYLSEDLSARRAAVVRDLYNFLEVDPEIRPSLEWFNDSTVPRFPRFNYWMHQRGLKRISAFRPIRRLRARMAPVLYTRRSVPKLETRDRMMMVDLYRADVRKLQDLVGRDLSSWLH